MICPNCKKDFQPDWRPFPPWVKIGSLSEDCKCPKCGFHHVRTLTKPSGETK